MNREKFEHGAAIRREVLGDQHVQQQLAATDAFNRPLQQWFVENIWSDVWGREALPRKTRSLLAIAYLLAQGRTEELKLHFPGALRNGCTLDEIREVILQGAAYCGGPAAMAATRVASAVLADEIASFKEQPVNAGS